MNENEYCLIATEKSWDSEAIDFEDVEIVACGSYEEVKQELIRVKRRTRDYYSDFVKRSTNPFDRPDMKIESEGEDFVTIYYPLAIAKTTYKIVKK